jgi:nucleotide-binding universal stress UspA family protein
MNLIVGVDVAGACLPAIQLLGRFRFEDPHTTLAHYVNPLPAFYPMEAAEAPQLIQEFGDALDQAGRDALRIAKDEACRQNLQAKSLLRHETPASGLTELADESHADLVAICAERGSVWASSFLGSVSRGLAIGCHASVLVAKGPCVNPGPLSVVLATDHSDVSQRSIEKFLSWRPKGISEVHVVTAYELRDRDTRVLGAHLPALGGDVKEWIEAHLAKLNAAVVEKLVRAGYAATSRVCVGKANDVIRDTMRETESDALVMGAQGHGFIKRLLIGSCAMHQVVAEPYPVLIVRA